MGWQEEETGSTGWVKKSAIVTRASFCKILSNFENYQADIDTNINIEKMKSIAVLLNLWHYFYHGIQCDKTRNFVHDKVLSTAWNIPI